MGIISITLLAAGIGFLFALQKRIEKIADEEGDEHVSWTLSWGSRFCGLIAVLGLVGVIDSYVYKLPNPFDGPTADLQADTPKEEIDVPPIKKVEKPDPMKDAKDEHEKALDEFSDKAEQR
jgi:hypothetical protein